MLDTAPVMTVPLQKDADDVIRIGNTRVTLETVIGCHRRGDTPEAIHEGFPTLPLGDIYAVIAYYLAHRDEVDAYLSQVETEGERLRREVEANDPQRAAFNARIRQALEEKRSKGRQ